MSKWNKVTGNLPTKWANVLFITNKNELFVGYYKYGVFVDSSWQPTLIFENEKNTKSHLLFQPNEIKYWIYVKELIEDAYEVKEQQT